MDIAGTGPAVGYRPIEPRRFDWKWLVIGVSVAIVAYLAVMPLAFLAWQSVHTPATTSAAPVLTLQNFREAYSTGETARLFGNSLRFAVGSAVIAFAIGTLLAWINERTNTPFKRLSYALAIVPLIIPGVLFAVAWILLGSPKIGLVNLFVQKWAGAEFVLIDVYTMPGMMFVDGLHYSPMAFLLMTAALRSMDPSLEESALMSGANVLQVASRITLRLAWPAAAGTLLILFVRALESFEVPALIGLPAGIQVFTSGIYQAIQQYPSRVGLASAYAMTLLVITAAGVWLQSRFSTQGDRYATVTGKAFRPRAIDLGRWRYLTAAIFALYFLLIVGLPFLVLLWSSLQSFYSVPTMEALGHLTLDPYRFVLGYPAFTQSVWNSVLLSLGSATSIMLLTSVICWIVIKTKIPGRRLLDNVASLPMVFPGIVLGLAIMIFYLQLSIGVYGTLGIMLIAYVTRFLPYGLRYNAASMLQIHRELEESAAMSGATWSATFRHVVLPLLKPGLIAGWIYIAIVSIRELSTSILLYTPGNEVVSIVIWQLWENGQYVELSALGVMLIVALTALVIAAQALGRRFGVEE